MRVCRRGVQTDRPVVLQNNWLGKTLLKLYSNQFPNDLQSDCQKRVFFELEIVAATSQIAASLNVKDNNCAIECSLFGLVAGKMTFWNHLYRSATSTSTPLVQCCLTSFGELFKIKLNSTPGNTAGSYENAETPTKILFMFLEREPPPFSFNLHPWQHWRWQQVQRHG